MYKKITPQISVDINRTSINLRCFLAIAIKDVSKMVFVKQEGLPMTGYAGAEAQRRAK